MREFCPSRAAYLSRCTRLENKRLHGTLVVHLPLSKTCPGGDCERYGNDRNESTHVPLSSLNFRMLCLFPIVGLPVAPHHPIGVDGHFVCRNWQSRCTRLSAHPRY